MKIIWGLFSSKFDSITSAHMKHGGTFEIELFFFIFIQIETIFKCICTNENVDFKNGDGVIITTVLTIMKASSIDALCVLFKDDAMHYRNFYFFISSSFAHIILYHKLMNLILTQ